MDIVTIQHYSLTAQLRENGDLELFGHDLSPGLEQMFGRDEYEYFYTVRAANLGRVRAELGDDVLAGVKQLIAPHGISASTEWKRWLNARAIPYDFSTR